MSKQTDGHSPLTHKKKRSKSRFNQRETLGKKKRRAGLHAKKHKPNPLKEALRKLEFAEGNPKKTSSEKKKVSAFKLATVRKKTLAIEMPALPKNDRSQRRIARMLATQILFAYESRNGNISEEEWSFMWQCHWEKQAEGAREFARILVKAVIDYKDKIDALIKSKLMNWSFERISIINKSVLRLAICQMLSFHAIPSVVIINEAVDLAKLFSSQEDHKFVNAVLDRLSLEIRDDEPTNFKTLQTERV